MVGDDGHHPGVAGSLEQVHPPEWGEVEVEGLAGGVAHRPAQRLVVERLRRHHSHVRSHVRQDPQLRAVVALDDADPQGVVLGGELVEDGPGPVPQRRGTAHLGGEGQVVGPAVRLGLRDEPEPALLGGHRHRAGAGDGGRGAHAAVSVISTGSPRRSASRAGTRVAIVGQSHISVAGTSPMPSASSRTTETVIAVSESAP